MTSIMNYSVQENKIEGEYKAYLHRPLFNVSERLYESSEQYRQLINGIVDYMKQLFSTEFSDYPKIKGVSGANLGIPFNIIVIRRKSNGKLTVMINPHIIGLDGNDITVKSNCGSLILDEPIEVQRKSVVKVEYYKVEKMRLRKRIGYFHGQEACTVQHEIDHNNGITILDRQKENDND